MRLSEVINDPVVKEPKSYRLSDVMRLGSYDIPPQNDLRELGVGENLVEGAVQAFASAPQVAGTFIMAYGDYVRKTADKMDKQGVIFGIKPLISAKGMGQRIFEVGEKISEANEKYINEKFPEQKNYTFADKFARGVGQGFVSLATAIGMGAFAGPTAPAIAFGMSAGAGGFVEAGEKGKTLDEAKNIGLMLGFAEGSLEFVGIKRLLGLKGGSIKKLVSNTVNGMATEFVQEFSQTGAEGVIKTATGLREYKGAESIKEILKDSLFSGAVGAVLGGGAGVTLSLTQRQAVEEGLVSAGIEKESAEIKADEMMKNTIEDVVTA
ncbi:MAG: hypothetical protein U9Q21_04290, partial [Candidatus Auribacterota bacterium]|nr:hypothetical protein [Candidatus Auribacterota bacterium]